MNKKTQVEKETPPEMGWKEKLLKLSFFHRQKFFQATFGILALAILVISYATKEEGSKGFLQAKAAFEQWKKEPESESLAKEMERGLQKIPGFRRLLEAEIAQVCLSHGQVQRANVKATPCIARLHEDFPLHAAFAKASLLIEEKEYQKALEASVTLKERLENSKAFVSLRGWNLVRLAFLHKQLQNSSGELSAWEDVKTFIQQEGEGVNIGLGKSDFSLADYIAYREQELGG